MTKWAQKKRQKSNKKLQISFMSNDSQSSFFNERLYASNDSLSIKVTIKPLVETSIKVEEEQDCQIDLNVTSYIPDTYIPDQNQKIEIYQDIALCKTEEDIRNVIDEMIDRFGNMPDEIENLLEISRIKQLAKAKYITKIQSKFNSIVFTYENDKFNTNSINELIQKYGSRIKFSSGIKPMITLKIEKNLEKEILNETKKFLQ